MANIEKLRAVLARIKADPTIWDQRVWICGTAACFAGHAVLMEGWKPCTFSGDRYEEPDEEYSAVCRELRQGEEYVETYDVHAKARDVLGLSNHEANILFQMDNTMEDLAEIVDALEDGFPVDPWARWPTVDHGTGEENRRALGRP
jgi:hypothetical protein